MEQILVDCGGCRARGPACQDCVISVLLGPNDQAVTLDDAELGALAVMADSGLLPPLRLVGESGSTGESTERFADDLRLA